MGSHKRRLAAIIGIGSRLPGDISTLSDLYQMLSRKRTGWSEVPADRFNAGAYHHPNPDRKGCFNSQGGYFISGDVSEFDAGFFDITKKEVESMDPAMRLLLECVYEALENGGVPKESISGKKVGVFVGANYSEHRTSNLRDLDHIPTFDATGNQGAFLAGRVSYYFNLRGPAVAVDTACSSSLHALHLAVQSIHAGESDLAIVAASHLLTDPDIWVSMGKLHLFSDAGKTYAFDHRAKSGYARGEGAACLILKPLASAEADNDYIYAVITHTGLSHNGRTVGIAAPSPEEQERLLRKVFAEARIDPREIGFFEAHGTGTKKGDPIEARAIYRAVSHLFDPEDPLHIGSVKPNVGHLECASGLVSVIKAALILSYRFILPNADFERANESIPLSQWNMKVATAQRPWPPKRKYVCVNNFGFSGSNSMAVLSAAPKPKGYEVSEKSRESPLRLYVLSAADETALRNTISRLSVWIERHAELYQSTLPKNLAYTLCQRRSHLPWRVAVVADMCGGVAAALNSRDTTMARAPSDPPRLAFVYTGQGAQWWAMGRELLRTHPVFLDSILRADEALWPIADFSIYTELTRDREESRVGLAHISQPLCTAVQLALTDLLHSFGIRPIAVTGHSSGEIAAAYAAGALGFKAAISAAFYRGRMITELKARHPTLRGSMMAVGAGASDLAPVLATVTDACVVVACENSPSSCTLSGDEAALDRVAVIMQQRGIFYRKLFVDVAYHSPHIQLIAESYLRRVGHIHPLIERGAAPVQFFSSLYGRRAAFKELGARYWVDNLTQAVRFSTALQGLCIEHKPDILIEVGPHAALQGPIKQILQAMGIAGKTTYLPTLIRDQDATRTCLETAGQLFVRGHPLNFYEVNHHHEENESPQLIPSPYTYPWTRQKYWYESRVSRLHRLKPFARHDLLGTMADWSSDLEPTWRNVFTTADLPWLRWCRVQSRMVFPAGGFVSMVIEAATQMAALKGTHAAQFDIWNLKIAENLFVDDDREYELVLTTRSSSWPNTDGSYDFHISSHECSRGWMSHCTGTLVAAPRRTPCAKAAVARAAQATSARARRRMLFRSAAMRAHKIYVSPGDWRGPHAVPFRATLAGVYQRLAAAGMVYPFSFQSFVAVEVDESEASGQLLVQDGAPEMPMSHEARYELRPSVAEAMFQLPVFSYQLDAWGKTTVPYLPSFIRHMTVHSSLAKAFRAGESAAARATPEPEPGSFMVELWKATDTTDPAAICMSGLKFAALEPSRPEIPMPRELCYKASWSYLVDCIPDGTAELCHNPRCRIVLVVRDMLQAKDPLVVALSSLLESKTGVAPKVRHLGEILVWSPFFFIVLSEVWTPVLASMGEEIFYRVKALLSQAPGLLWVTKGATRFPTCPKASLASGLLRTVRSERSIVAATLDLDPDSWLDAAAQAALIWEAFATSVLSEGPGPTEMEFAEADGTLTVPRIVPDKQANVEVQRNLGESAPYWQNFHQPGRPLSLAPQRGGSGSSGGNEEVYFEDAPKTPLGEDEVEIAVTACTLSAEDVAAGNTGRVTRGCCGRVTRVGRSAIMYWPGDRVLALVEGRFSSRVRAKLGNFICLPRWITREQAASIPDAVIPAIYALEHLIDIHPKERVLIDMSGPIGLAAIQVTRARGAIPLVLIRNKEQARAAQRAGVPDHRILDARSAYLRKHVHAATRGRGADAALVLAGPNTAVAVKCLADFGRLVEIRRGSHPRTRVELGSVNAAFASVDMYDLATQQPESMQRTLMATIENMRFGLLDPLPAKKVVPVSKLARGLRLVRKGAVEPVVVRVDGRGRVKAVHRRPKSVFRSDATHIVVGGTGGLGRSVAKYMMENGARHIVLVSRSGLHSGVVEALKPETERYRAMLTVMKCDVADMRQVTEFVEDCRRHLPPICGVVHAAMVLRDTLLDNLTYDDYRRVIRPKVDGAWNMHMALEARYVPLEYFVVFSSTAGIIGSRGQGAYAAANAFLDALIQHRVRIGLPGAALDLTAVTNAGYLAENEGRQEGVFRNFGHETISEREVLALLSAAVRGVGGPQYLTGLKLRPACDGDWPYYAAHDRRFDMLKAASLAQAKDESEGFNAPMPTGQAFQEAGSEEEATSVAAQGLIEKLSDVLSISPDDLDVARDITAFGLDSLTAIEIRNWVSKEYRVTLEIMQLLSSGTIMDLAASIVKNGWKKKN
ncbi:ddfcf033-124e-48c3-8647-9deef8689590 [Thermothielavioides terrestris]|uniref:Ddfcf033-124e-48c3-8647-9deef8689590 n=1 Tax=Thermothielavioides terrestris TaxID=2587410 RepID=A0A446BNQ2_9PEZI|nr:ddfcf033-124e-48c3-8647-9deef8689590 [Thermothielavioides terrestris]